MTDFAPLQSLTSEAQPLISQNTTNLEPEKATALAAILRSDSDKKFSSSHPNQALLWALIDDSPQNADDHEEALAAVDGWKPMPWKGMVWRANTGHDRVWTGPTHQDLTWTGRCWEPIELTQAVDRPLIAAKQSSVSVELTDAYRAEKGKTSNGIGAVQLNQAYEAYELDQDGERDNLWVAIASFARSRERVAQCRNLILRNPEIAREVDDIFMAFTADLHHRMAAQYKHEGKLDRWIAVIWGRYFFRGIKKEVIEYLSDTRFVNNRSAEDAGYWFEDHCVNTEQVTSDDAVTDERINSVDRFLRELDNPKSPLSALPAPSKLMLRGVLEGESTKQTAHRMGITPRHALRLLSEAVSECRKINQKPESSELVGDLQGCAESDYDNVICIQACADEGKLLAWPSDNVIGTIQACASSGKFLTPDEAAEYLGGLNARTVTRWAREGYLPAYPIGEGKRRLWRFLQTDLEEWMLARRQGGKNAA